MKRLLPSLSLALFMALGLLLPTGARAADMALTSPHSALRTPAANSILADIIRQKLASNPATRDLYVQVDAWDGLAILHGWTLTGQQREAVDAIVRGIDGVDRVYNFMIADTDLHSPAQAMRFGYAIRVAMSNANDHIWDTGIFGDLTDMPVTAYTSTRATQPIAPKLRAVVTVPDELARAVKYRLYIQPFGGVYEIVVNSYKGLVVLHGHVPSLFFKHEAESIAAHTPGVRQVYSYLTLPETEAPVAEPWPVVVELNHEPLAGPRPSAPVYARFEERNVRDCGR